MKNNLAEMRPHLQIEWSQQNAPLTPADISYGSNKQVWWRGACGHEWQTSVKARSAGEQCPICSGARVLAGVNDLQTTHPDLAEQWSAQNGVLRPSMVSAGSHKKVYWQGKCGHTWVAMVKSRVQGTGCPYCSHNLVLAGFNDLASQFPELAAEWSERNLPLQPTMVTAFRNQKVWWRCAQGHEWNALISTRAYGSQCPYCSGIRVLKDFNDLRTTHPQLAAEWSEKNLPLTADEVNEKSRKNVWWKCASCGNVWKAVIHSRVMGVGCPVCANRAVFTGRNDLTTTDHALAAEWAIEANKGLLPSKMSRNSMKRVWWQCPRGHLWNETIAGRAIEGKNCKVCERAFRQALPLLLVAFYAQQKGMRVLLQDSQTLGVPLDTYLPEISLAIEFSAPQNEEERNLDLVKEVLCRGKEIARICIPFHAGVTEMALVAAIKQAFCKRHIFIVSNGEEELRFLRNRYFAIGKS